MDGNPFVDRFGIADLEARAHVSAQGVVDYLMALRDRLEADLFQTQTQSKKLMEIAVQQVLATATNPAFIEKLKG